MMNFTKKGIRLYKNRFLYFFKKNRVLLALSFFSSSLISLLFFFITGIPFFILVFFPTFVLFLIKQKIFEKFTIFSKLIFVSLISLVIIFLLAFFASFVLEKSLFFTLIIWLYLIIYTIVSIVLYYFFLFISKNEYLFIIFSFFISFILAVLSKSFLFSLIIFSLFFYLSSLIYYTLINLQSNKKKTKIFLFIILIFLIAISFFLVQFTGEKQDGNLLTQSLFKFNFNDQVNLKTDYKFKGTLLFIAKLEDSKLLKAVSYPEFSREKGFYFTTRDLPFPPILIEKIWENEDYIKGERKIEQITAYNLNLADGIVFGPNEPYRIVPYIKVTNSRFTSIFSTYSKSIKNFEEIMYDIDFSSNNLSKDLYLKYTSFGKKDSSIEELINKYSDFYKDRRDYIIFYYQYLKKNYYYSISTFQKEGYEGILSFLFKTKKGYCAHFASTYALLLRYYGIPARVVGGFKAIEDNKLLDYYRFYDFNAHSWVEVYTDQYGWIPIDPTSDRISEDEMLPFEKPIDEDESSLLEEILKLEKQLQPQQKKLENEIKEQKKEINLSLKDYLYIVLPIIFIILLIVFKNNLIILLSLFFPHLIYKSYKIYMKRIAKILKKDFITAEELIEYSESDESYFNDFAKIYDNLYFAPEKIKKMYISRKNVIISYKAYCKIVKKLKKIKKSKNISIQ